MGQTQFRSDDTVKWWLGFGDGSDGDYNSVGNATDAPIDSSCSGTSGSVSLTATNASFASGKPVLIHQSRGTNAGQWELNQIQSYTAGTITLVKPLQNTYTDSGASQAQVIQLKQYNNFTQNSGHTLTAKAWDGNVGGIIAFLCKEIVNIQGIIFHQGGNAHFAQSSGGGFFGSSSWSNTYCPTGEGTSGASVSNSRNANGNGGGGGERDTTDVKQGGAGGGGNATNGGNGTASSSGKQYGYGGGQSGNVSLTSCTFGGGGGSTGNGGFTSIGGNGGGICMIFGKTITNTGSINCKGSDGEHGGAGAGGGGSILFKAVNATLGSNLINAGGGSGGAVDGSATGRGGNGGLGRIHLDYSGTYSGTTTPTLDYTQDLTIKSVGGSKPLFFAQY